MKPILAVLLLSIEWKAIESLQCWTCINAKNSFDCLYNGKLQACMKNEKACQNEIRREATGFRITKKCSQEESCTSNRIQNPRHAWLPTQCNLLVPNSVCRCCCGYDGCNKEKLSCSSKPSCPPIETPKFGMKVCRFSENAEEIGANCLFRCNKGYRLVGARRSKCVLDSETDVGFFSRKSPRCVFKPPPTCRHQRAPRHGSVSCSDGVKVGSVCKYACDDFHLLVGLDTIRCDRKGNWNGIPPACVQVSCPELPPPVNGSLSCTYGFDEDSTCTFSCIPGYEVIGARSSICVHLPKTAVWSQQVPKCERKKCNSLPPPIKNGNYLCNDENFLNSVCEFTCDPRYKRVGPMYNTCVEKRRRRTVWDNEPPKCERIRCKDQGSLRNGRLTCTNGNELDSICSFECTTEDFNLSPAEVTSNICLNDSTWSFPQPCCSRVCPPFSVLDLVIIIDSSSSIGRFNWRTIKRFIRELIDTFEIGEDSARIGVFRYNNKIDTRSEILLRDFPENKEDLLRAFDDIPYDGFGTRTGNALRHARNVHFAPGSGNRPDVPDYAIVITDGRSSDNVAGVSRRLHNDGVHVLAIGVVPQRGSLDLHQLNDIVSDANDLVIATSGFEDLTINLFHDLVRNLCTPGCL